MLERCVFMLKPDGRSLGLEAKVQQFASTAGFQIISSMEIQLSVELIKDWRRWPMYDDDFYKHCLYICAAPVIAFLVEGENAIECMLAYKKELRKAYGKGVFANVAHCADCCDEATDDIRFFFPAYQSDAGTPSS